MIEMRCNIRRVYVERPTISTGKIVVIPKTEFERLRSQAYLTVLSKEYDESMGAISKSYYYYIVNRLKKLGLLDESGRLAFKLALSYDPEGEALRFDDEYLIHLPPFVYLVTNERANGYTETLLSELIGELSGRRYKKGDLCEKLRGIIRENLAEEVLGYPLMVLR